MARNTIKYQLKQELEKQASYGRSKHQDKIGTYQKREEMKQQPFCSSQAMFYLLVMLFGTEQQPNLPITPLSPGSAFSFS